MKIYFSLDTMVPLDLNIFDLKESHPILILGGKTSQWEEEKYTKILWPFFIKLALALINADTSHCLTVLTGGTQCGVIQMFGQACEYTGYRPKALIGIAPYFCVHEMKINLEEHHSHILFTPGRQWDQAIPFMRTARKIIASHKPSLMLAIGGGNDTLKEMLAHAHDQVPLYALKEGGRLANGFMAKADATDTSPRTLHQQIQAMQSVHLLEPSEEEETIQKLIIALGFTLKDENVKKSLLPY